MQFACIIQKRPLSLQRNKITNRPCKGTKHKVMKTITPEIKKAAKEKSRFMQLGTYSRLKINGEISDIVIQPTSSGVYFYNVPGTIGRDILDKVIGFIYYSEL